MKVTTRSSYTVRALLDLAQHSKDGKPVRLSDISEREGISHAYLEQLFNRLKRVQVVRGRKGPGGGYILAKEADRILMGEVIRAVEGEEKLFLCTEEHEIGTGCRRYPSCTTHALWERLSCKIHDYLNSISLEDMLKDADSFEDSGDE
jgi:Rrf2 family iron-sulfur cluster assembly transcriptional regulator